MVHMSTQRGCQWSSSAIAIGDVPADAEVKEIARQLLGRSEEVATLAVCRDQALRVSTLQLTKVHLEFIKLHLQETPSIH
jgi:hypothetical protein